MKDPRIIESWIKAGYKLLGADGLGGLKVERVARLLQLNKSGFYHYFGSMESYLKYLLQFHMALAKAIAEEISKCDTVDPDLLVLIVKHKTFFQVESQLHFRSKSFNNGKDWEEASKILNARILRLWGIPDLSLESSVSGAYAKILHHFFYTRINSESISYKFLHQLTEETKDVLSKVVERQ